MHVSRAQALRPLVPRAMPPCARGVAGPGPAPMSTLRCSHESTTCLRVVSIRRYAYAHEYEYTHYELREHQCGAFEQAFASNVGTDAAFHSKVMKLEQKSDFFGKRGGRGVQLLSTSGNCSLLPFASLNLLYVHAGANAPLVK